MYININITKKGFNSFKYMVYGKILFNNIKEYTPKWYPTIPYSQTIKPVFGNTLMFMFRKETTNCMEL